MVRKTRSRKTHRSKSHKRRHTRKNGGACPCSMRSQFGGRGGMGGAELGHAFTSGASQELYQMTGRTPGLSSGGGSKATKKRRQAALATAAANRERMAMIARRHREFKKSFMGMPVRGYEGNEYKHLSRNEIKNKIKEEALSNYVRKFGNNEGFYELNLELNNNNNNNNNNMGNVIVPASKNYKSKLKNLRKTKKNKY